MIYPTTEQIAQLGGDRYMVTVATAKCARRITEEYMAQREAAEKLINRKETDKPLFSLLDEDLRDDKAVKTAIKRLLGGEYVIVTPEEKKAE